MNITDFIMNNMKIQEEIRTVLLISSGPPIGI